MIRNIFFLAFLFLTFPFPLPGARAADSCYPKFRDPMDKVIGWTSQDCKALQSDEPSVCQRSVGERCQKSYDEIRRIRADVCAGLGADATFIESRRYAEGVDSQKAGQDANASLNSDTSTVSESMGVTLATERDKVSQLMRENEAVIRSETCTKSASYPTYSNRMKILSDNLTVVRELLDAFSKKKKNDAKKAGVVASASENRAQGMSSITPMVGNSYQKENQLKKWMPAALLGGGAIAAFYAIHKFKDGGTSPPPAGLDPPQEPSKEPTPGAPAEPPPFQGDPDKFLKENGLFVDPSFTDANRREIAQAVNQFPACQRKWLEGVVARNNPRLVWASGPSKGKCLPGKNTAMKPPTIELNASCYGVINTALVVHELMHVLANRRGYYVKYNAAFSKSSGCPVSPYSGTYGGRNINEDFAEAGRIAIYPSSGQRNGGACVDEKVRAASEIVNSCN